MASPDERRAIRYVCYAAYVFTVGGGAAAVGTPWGWFIGIAGALVPGVAMLRYELDERSIKRDRAAGVGQHRGEADEQEDAAPGPLPPPPPPPPPAY